MNSHNSPSRHISDELLFEFLDQALTQAEIDQVNWHIEICSSCDQRLAEMRSFFSSIEDLTDKELKRDLAPAVVAAIQGKTNLSPIWWWSVVLQGILALGIITIAASQLGALDFGLQTVEILTSGFKTYLQEWVSFMGIIQVQIGRLFEFQLPLSLNLPLQPIIWLLLFATLTWIIGNVILLRPQYRGAEK